MSEASNQEASRTDRARQRASEAYDSAAESVSHAYEATRDGVRSAAHQAGTAVDSAPLAVLVGGLAVGAIAGALLPRSQREEELLAPIGQRLTETATAAARAAKEAGRTELDALGLTPDSAKTTVSRLVSGAAKAASEAGSAAVAEVKSTRTATDASA